MALVRGSGTDLGMIEEFIDIGDGAGSGLTSTAADLCTEVVSVMFCSDICSCSTIREARSDFLTASKATRLSPLVFMLLTSISSSMGLNPTVLKACLRTISSSGASTEM